MPFHHLFIANTCNSTSTCDFAVENNFRVRSGMWTYCVVLYCVGLLLFLMQKLRQIMISTVKHNSTCTGTEYEHKLKQYFPNSQLSHMSLHSPKRNIFNYLTGIKLLTKL